MTKPKPQWPNKNYLHATQNTQKLIQILTEHSHKTNPTRKDQRKSNEATQIADTNETPTNKWLRGGVGKNHCTKKKKTWFSTTNELVVKEALTVWLWNPRSDCTPIFQEELGWETEQEWTSPWTFESHPISEDGESQWSSRSSVWIAIVGGNVGHKFRLDIVQ